jgi:hypothetical protein
LQGAHQGSQRVIRPRPFHGLGHRLLRVG